MINNLILNDKITKNKSQLKKNIEEKNSELT